MRAQVRRPKKQPVKPAKSAFRWVRLPHQARSQKKLEDIVAAAEKLIARKGFAAASIPEIAREAGCSVGLIYTRFRDKDDLLRYLIEHFLDEALATGRQILKPENWAGVPFEKMTRIFVKGWVALHERNEGLFLAFYESLQRDPVLAKRFAAVAAEMEELTYRLALSRAGEIAHPDLRAGASFALRIPTSMLLHHALLKNVPGRAMTAEALTREITRTLLAYWGVSVKPK